MPVSSRKKKSKRSKPAAKPSRTARKKGSLLPDSSIDSVAIDAAMSLRGKRLDDLSVFPFAMGFKHGYRAAKNHLRANHG
jgi:hypothetical protein